MVTKSVRVKGFGEREGAGVVVWDLEIFFLFG